MKGQIIIATKYTPGCAFEEWSKDVVVLLYAKSVTTTFALIIWRTL